MTGVSFTVWTAFVSLETEAQQTEDCPCSLQDRDDVQRFERQGYIFGCFNLRV